MVALAESCISCQIARNTPNLVGARLDLSGVEAPRLDALLFGEHQSRIVVSVAPEKTGMMEAFCRKTRAPFLLLGRTGGSELQIQTTHGTLAVRLAELHDIWWNSIARRMKS